jgi:hypothetical protein
MGQSPGAAGVAPAAQVLARMSAGRCRRRVSTVAVLAVTVALALDCARCQTFPAGSYCVPMLNAVTCPAGFDAGNRCVGAIFLVADFLVSRACGSEGCCAPVPPQEIRHREHVQRRQRDGAGDPRFVAHWHPFDGVLLLHECGERRDEDGSVGSRQLLHVRGRPAYVPPPSARYPSGVFEPRIYLTIVLQRAVAVGAVARGQYRR